MRGMRAVVSLLFLLIPCVVAGQTSAGEISRDADDDRRSPLSAQFAAGPMIGGGGSGLSGSIGYSPTPRLTFLVTGERSHVPSRVESDGNGYSASRGGTLQFISLEMRVALLSGERPSPYVLMGAGRGVSRPNVNEIFTDPVRNDARVMFYGGGIRVPLGRNLSVFGDVRIVIVGERGEVGALLPIRGGVAWHF